MTSVDSFKMTVPVQQGLVRRNGRIDVQDIQSRQMNRSMGAAREIEVYPASVSDSAQQYSVLQGDACFVRKGVRHGADALTVISSFNGAHVSYAAMEKQFGHDDWSKARRALAEKYTFVGVAGTNIFYNTGSGHRDPQDPVITINGVVQVNNFSGSIIPAGCFVRVRFPLTKKVRNPILQGYERDWIKAQYVQFDLSDVFVGPTTLRENLELDKNKEQHVAQDNEKEDAPLHFSIQTFIQAVAYIALRMLGGLQAEPDAESIARFAQITGLDRTQNPTVLTADQSRRMFGTEHYAGMSTSKALVSAALGMAHDETYANVSGDVKHAVVNGFADMCAENEAAVRRAISTIAGRALSTADIGGKFDMTVGQPNI